MDWLQLKPKFKDNCLPCGIDFGGSALKVITVTDSEDNVKSIDGCVTCTLKTATFSSRDGLDAALQHIQASCHQLSGYKSKDIIPDLHGTGLTLNLNQDRISEKLGVRLQLHHEVPLLVKGFKHLLQTLPYNVLLHHIPDDLYGTMATSIVTSLQGAEQFQENIGIKEKVCPGTNLENLKDPQYWMDRNRDVLEDESVPFLQAVGTDTVYPYMISVLGSSLMQFIIEEDGTPSCGHFNSSCGKTLMGLGSMLTGCKTFEELISLAEKGNSENVDVTALDQFAGGSQTDTYNEVLRALSKIVIFSFGKTEATSVDKWKKSDLAKALLRKLLDDILIEVLFSTHKHGIRRVFFTGSMVESEFLRRELISCLGVKWAIHKEDNAKYHFVKQGGHVVALGTFLQAVESVG